MSCFCHVHEKDFKVWIKLRTLVPVKIGYLYYNFCCVSDRFSQHLTKKFGWDFETEPEDCAPVIVDELGNY